MGCAFEARVLESVWLTLTVTGLPALPLPVNELMMARTMTTSIAKAARRRHQPAQSSRETVAEPGSASPGGSSSRSRKNHCSAPTNACDAMKRRNAAIRVVA